MSAEQKPVEELVNTPYEQLNQAERSAVNAYKEQIQEIQRMKEDIQKYQRGGQYYESDLTSKNVIYTMQRDIIEREKKFLPKMREGVLQAFYPSPPPKPKEIEADRTPGGAAMATIRAQTEAGTYTPPPKQEIVYATDLQGFEVSNLLHGGEESFRKYRGTTGKLYGSQYEAYLEGAAPKPPTHYILGLEETIGIQSKPPPNIAPPKEERVTPQRTRTTILKDQPPSQYASPTYVRKGQTDTILTLTENIDTTRQPVNYLLGLTETIYTKPPPKNLAISLSEGKPSKPREYTQEQVNRMTPQEYALYVADINAYNQYQKEQYKKERAQAKIEGKKNITEIRAFVDQAAAMGYKTISVQTTEGPKDIPIGRAKYDLLKGSVDGAKITGIGLAPIVPKGYTISGLSNQVLVPTKESIQKAQYEEEQRRIKGIIERDPTGLSKFIFKEEQMAQGIGPTKPLDPNSLARAGSYYYAALGTNIAGLMNIAKAGTGFVLEKLGGTKLGIASALGTPTQYEQKIKDPYTLGFTAPLTAAQVAIQEGNATKFPIVLKEEVKTAIKIGHAAPIGQIFGQGAAFFVTSGTPLSTKLLRVLPLRYTSLPIYTKEGLAISQKTLSIGYDRLLKPLVGKYGPIGESKFFTGRAEPVKAGAEKIAAPVGGSSFERFQPSNLSTAQRNLLKPLIQYGEEKELTPKGFTTELEPRLIKSQRQETSTPYKYEKQVPPKILSGLESGQPTYTVLGEVGKTTQKKLIEPAKGSIIQRLLEGGLSREIGDIDVEAPTLKKAEKASERLGKMEIGKDYVVERQGFNISIKNPKKGTEAEINIISPKEEIKNVLGVSTEKVYGLKYPTKKVKFSIPESKEKFYTKTMQYQTRAKTASITGIETRESLLAEGMSVEDVNRIMGSSKYVFAPKGRRLQKDIMDRYMGEREAARVEFQSGNRAKALESAKTMVAIQKYYGPMIKDFGAAIREYKPSISFDEPLPKKPTSEKVLGVSASVTPNALRMSSPVISTEQGRQSPYTKSVYSGSARIGSVKIESPRPGLSARSGRSAFSSGSIKSGLTSTSVKSAGISSSVKTITSSSAKTSSAELSAKSGLSRSGSSGKSGLSASPSPSTKSTFGPSPQSIFSPSPRLPVSPLSITTPSPLSPVSPLSITTPSPLSPPSPKSPSLMPRPSPTLQPVPQLKPIGLRPPFLKNRTDKQKTTKKETVEFFGSTHIASVLGFRSKKKDFDYGKDLSGKAAKDVKSTDPIKRTALNKKRSGMILSNPQRYFTPTKKQSKNFLKL